METVPASRGKGKSAVGAGGSQKISRTAGDLRARDGISRGVDDHTRDRAGGGCGRLLFGGAPAGPEKHA